MGEGDLFAGRLRGCERGGGGRAFFVGLDANREQSMLGEALLKQGKTKEAEAHILQGYEGMKQREKTIPPGSTRLWEAAWRVAEYYEAIGDKEKAKEWRVKEGKEVPVTDDDRKLFENLDKPDWFGNAEVTAQLRAVLEPLAAHYFLKARTAKGRLIDSVARFHLGNGARLERINWLGDLSPKGLRESAGIMVNYLYRLDDIEKNHEAYANEGEVVASSAVKKLLKGERRLLDMRLS